mgnify:CR=1 FL=1
MDTAIKFLYLSEPDMIRAGVTDMDACVEAMEDLLVTLNKGDYVCLLYTSPSPRDTR